MEKNSKITSFQLPPGFRFHPSDEELVMHYLINKAYSRPLPAHVIAEVELYKFNPWDLPKRAVFGEEEWYFFTPRERKYPNGQRPNRMAASGYWKATGTDKPVVASCGSKVIGLKKALVFYKGKPPKGSKTDWIMHEYRLPLPLNPCTTTSKRVEGSMRLDDWVLCRVWHKNSMAGSYGEDGYGVGKPNLNITTETSAENSQLESCPTKLPFLFGFQQHYYYSNCMDNAVSSLSYEGITQSAASLLSHEAENTADLLSNRRKRKLINEGLNQEHFIQSDYNNMVNFDGDEPKAEGLDSICADAAGSFACVDTTTDQLWDIVLQY